MPSRNVLLCFDAFGTLFRPRKPAIQQYAEIARSLGLVGFTDEQLQASFNTAFKNESKRNPNYGKVSGMDAKRWWTNIIHNTFHPLVGRELQIRNELAPRLLHLFSSAEGYAIIPGVVQLLQQLRTRPLPNVDNIVIGVITNSDDRVPAVLTSLGLRVSPLRFGTKPATGPPASEQYDVEFTVMSYDAGFEKPDKRIFEAAESMLQMLPNAFGTHLATWDKIYIGDEFEKDVQGAADAGWYGILVPGDEDTNEKHDIPCLDKPRRGSLLEVLRKDNPMIAVSCMASLARLLDCRENVDKVTEQ